MSVIDKIMRLISGRREPKQKDADDRTPQEPDERMGGGSPHDLGMSRYAGSFREE